MFCNSSSFSSPSLPALTGRTRQFKRCLNSRVRPVVGQALSDRSTCRRVGQACPISSWDRSHRTSQDRLDKSVQPVGSRFGRTVPVRPPVKHGCSSTARPAVFDRLMPAVLEPKFFFFSFTAGINRSNTAVQAVLKQPCLTGGRTGTVRPKHLPAVPVRPPVKHGCSSTARTAVFDRLMPAVLEPKFFFFSFTAGINRSNTAVQAVLKQPCLTGGRTGTVRPKHLPAGWTGLSDQFLGPVAQDQPGPVGQICPTSWLLLWSDSARPTTGRTRLFEHRSTCRVRPVNAGSA
ncbi:hypothetical protein PCANC_19335 [Puccinia coronata f. sp. avenae]|uniref:Uncharacterized protein n=1 Tax=Puccinia coronata f. sp. avenae TaxID=200324 RepID=A0A2N5SIK6_9BASI|nr:hypothetical protein PCANC_19335 [Puccinia coronata f. sp. avenae]